MQDNSKDTQLMTENTQEIMTFRTGASLFGVPIQNVLSILGESDKLFCKAFSSKDGLGIIEYRGTPVAVIDLALAGNVQSDSVLKTGLIDTLLTKEQDHINWLDALEKSIIDDEPFTLSRDPVQCDVDHWHKSFHGNDEELTEILVEIDEPHKKIYELADKLDSMKSLGDKDKVLSVLQNERDTTSVKLCGLFARAVAHLRSSIKPVFIYLTLDGITPCAAIRVDEIADVNSAEDDAFVPMSEMALPQVRDMKYIMGFLKMGEKGDCLLIDVEILTNHRDLSSDQQKSA